MYLLHYCLRKTWFNKCLRSTVSEDPSTSNMVNGVKHFSKLNENTLTIFNDLFEYI